MITLLKDKLPQDLVERYNMALQLEPGLLNKLNVEFIMYWHDCGTVNCHTYPVIPGETSLDILQENVYKIKKVLNAKCPKYMVHDIESDWVTYDNGPCELKYIAYDKLNIYTLIAFALLIIKDYDRTLFHIAKNIDEIFIAMKVYNKPDEPVDHKIGFKAPSTDM